ncbi:MAG TPA: helix-turn-helix domain-containing protein [Candidatus Acidoferrum sp.]|nr:helix-turn-helix domain-containing protein [Candidatus Acidoferrum sp.]
MFDIRKASVIIELCGSLLAHSEIASMTTKTLHSLERGIDLLFLFSEEQPTLSLPEIAKALGLPGSTAYRLVATCSKKNVLFSLEQVRPGDLRGVA